jgi:putative aldouronate transport system substrate-binding protein
VNIDIEVVPWGDWGSRRNVIVSTGGGDFDIIFSPGSLVIDVASNALMDITELLPKAAPDLYAMIPEAYYEAEKVGGKLYAIPTYKDSSASQYFIWDQNLADELGIDTESIKTFQDADEALRKITEHLGEPGFIIHKDSGSWLHREFDAAGSGLGVIGVRYDDETRTVVKVFEQQEVMDRFALHHQWYEDGIINSDAATRPEETTLYRPFSVAQGWSLAAKTVWGPNMGMENCTAFQYGPTIVSNGTVQGSANAISANSAHPEKALEFLQLVNTDSYVRDLLYYGVEGDDWQYTEDGRVHKNNANWTMAGYTQGTFFNVTPTDDVEFNQWDEVKELNANAEASVLIGFSFDTAPIADQLANCIEIMNRYLPEIRTGTVDPTEGVPAMYEEMDAAGLQDIIDEMQSQINAWAAE